MDLLRTTVFVLSFGSGLLISMTEATNKRAVFQPHYKPEISTTSTPRAPITTTPAISDGDAGQCPWGQLLQRNGTVCCWVISCSPGYSIQNCVMSGGNDTCQKCNTGYIQPHNVTSFNMDEATCFTELNTSEHTDCSTDTLKTKAKSTEERKLRNFVICPWSCECDTTSCYTGSPCGCSPKPPCDPHYTLNKTSEKCEPCPRFFYKLEAGCFPCTLNITAFSMGNEYKPVTKSVAPAHEDNSDSGETQNNSTSVINDGVINPAGEKQDSNTLMSNVAIVLACLSVLIVSAVLFILLKRKKLTRCQPKVGLCCTSYHSVARDGIEMDATSTCSNTDTKLLNTTETNRLLTTSEQNGRTDRINGHIANGHIANGHTANGNISNGHIGNGHISNSHVGRNNKQNGINTNVLTNATNGVKEYKVKRETLQGAAGGASYQGHVEEERDINDDSEIDSKCDADSIDEIGACDIIDGSRQKKRYYLEGESLGIGNYKNMNKNCERSAHKGYNGRKKCDKNGGDVVIESERFEDRTLHIGGGSNANDYATPLSMFMDPAIINHGNVCQFCNKNKISDNSVRPKTYFNRNTFNNCNFNFCGCSAESSSKIGVAEEKTRLLDDTSSQSSNNRVLGSNANSVSSNDEMSLESNTFNSENKNMSFSQPTTKSDQSFIRVHENVVKQCPSIDSKTDLGVRSESEKSARAEAGIEKNNDSFKKERNSIESDKLNSVPANMNKAENMKENDNEDPYKAEQNSVCSEAESGGNILNSTLNVDSMSNTALVSPRPRNMPLSPNTANVPSFEVRPSINRSVSSQDRPTARVPPIQRCEPQSHHVSHTSGGPSLNNESDSNGSLSYAMLHHNPTYSNGIMCDVANLGEFESIDGQPSTHNYNNNNRDRVAPMECRRELPDGREQPDGCSMSHITGYGFVSNFEETDPKTYARPENGSNIDCSGIENTQPKVINDNFPIEAIVNNEHSIATESSFELYDSVKLDSEFSEDVDNEDKSSEGAIHTTYLSGDASVELSIVDLSSHIESESDGNVKESSDLSVRDSNARAVNEENAKEERQDLNSVELSQVDLNSHVDLESEDNDKEERQESESDGSVELSGVEFESSLESGGE